MRAITVMATLSFVISTLALAAPVAADESACADDMHLCEEYLGARVMDMTPELRAFFGAPKNAGILVSKVVQESPAGRVGVRVGDVIVEVDGTRIAYPDDMGRALSPKKKGDRARVVLVRQKRRVTLEATMSEDAQSSSADGIQDHRRVQNWRSARVSGGESDQGKRAVITGKDETLRQELDKTWQRLRTLEERVKALESRK